MTRTVRLSPRAAVLNVSLASSLVALAGCASTGMDRSTNSNMGMTPTSDRSAPMGQPGIPFSGARTSAEMQAVIDAHGALGYRPIETLSPRDARRQPTAADGVKAVLRQQGKPTTPPPGITTRDIAYTGPGGSQPARIYMPDGVTGPMPVIVYYHGGGFVIADINVYDSSARALAREARAMVVSVEYRHAPEHKFPAQQEDAFAAYRYVLANAARLGGDPKRVAVAGESAGGNLAVNVAMMARDANVQAPVHQLLVYPVAASDMNLASKQANSNAKPLNRAMLMWFYHHTGRTPADAMDPRLNLVAANLRDLPPATIILAQIDPLRDDGTMLADAMRKAGSNVTVREFDGVAHEFFGMDAVVQTAAEAQRFAGTRLRTAFAR